MPFAPLYPPGRIIAPLAALLHGLYALQINDAHIRRGFFTVPAPYLLAKAIMQHLPATILLPFAIIIVSGLPVGKVQRHYALLHTTLDYVEYRVKNAEKRPLTLTLQHLIFK